METSSRPSPVTRAAAALRQFMRTPRTVRVASGNDAETLCCCCQETRLGPGKPGRLCAECRRELGG